MHLRRTKKNIFETKLRGRNLIKGIDISAVLLVRYCEPLLRNELRLMNKKKTTKNNEPYDEARGSLLER